MIKIWYGSLRFSGRIWNFSNWSCRDRAICYEMLRNFGVKRARKDDQIAQNSAIGTGPHAGRMIFGYGLEKRREPFFEKNSVGRDFWMLRNVTKFPRNFILPRSWRGRWHVERLRKWFWKLYQRTALVWIIDLKTLPYAQLLLVVENHSFEVWSMVPK